jgi:hypothetical protein
MTGFCSICKCSCRTAEKQLMCMLLFITKYELRMITIKERQFHNKDNTLLYSQKDLCDINKIYVIK